MPGKAGMPFSLASPTLAVAEKDTSGSIGVSNSHPKIARQPNVAGRFSSRSGGKLLLFFSWSTPYQQNYQSNNYKLKYVTILKIINSRHEAFISDVLRLRCKCIILDIKR
jgi:hypothetical protein